MRTAVRKVMRGTLVRRFIPCAPAFFLTACTVILPREDLPPDPIVRGPYLQRVTAHTASVVWLTEEPLACTLRWYPRGDPAAARAVVEADPATAHIAELEGLEPDTPYRYEILARGNVIAGGDGFEVRTAPVDPNRPFRVVVIGDSGTGSDEQLRIASLIEKLEPDLFLHTGDLIYTFDPDRVIFEPYRRIFARRPFYPVRGNHDAALDRLAESWKEVFPPPPGQVTVGPEESLEHPCCEGREEALPFAFEEPAWYSFDWGGVHFAGLDYFAGFDPCNPQMRWLCRDLEEARRRGAQWLVVYLHEPVYTRGSYGFSQLRTQTFLPLLLDHYGVDLVISGHDHNYQRTYPVRARVVRDGWQDPDYTSPRGTVYLVTGGGGAGTYAEIPQSVYGSLVRLFAQAHHVLVLDFQGRTLEGHAIDMEGETIDRFTIRKEGERPPFRLIRGDVDGGGRLTISDAIAALGFLFLGKRVPCPASIDFDGGGVLNINDPIGILRYLFASGPPPAPPFPECGVLPEADDAWCTASNCP